MTWNFYIAIVLALAAPFVGRFLAALVLRFPDWRGAFLARSTCRQCAAPTPLRAEIPFLGWVAASRRCQACGHATPASVPLFEMAALGIALWSLSVFDGTDALIGAFLGWILLAASAIDQRTMLLPDSLTLSALILGLAVAAADGPDRLLDALTGSAAGFGAFALVGWTFRRLRGVDGLGLGDAKLLAAAGAWVGWQLLPWLVLTAALTAIVLALAATLAGRGELHRRLPFGPHLALAAWLTVLYGPTP